MDISIQPKWPFISKSKKETKMEESALPNGRQSLPDLDQSLSYIKGYVEFIKPEFQYDMIPVIRKLTRTNSSVSLASNTIVELANTGFNYRFSKEADPKEELRKREHLDAAFKRWGKNLGVPSAHGIVNKLIAQVYVGGAMSCEWVLSKNLDQVEYPAFLNAENIRTGWNSKSQKYEFYQVPRRMFQLKKNSENFKDYIKLNPFTYQYYGFFSDEEKPIGIPPFLSALDDVQGQLKMLRNIGFVSDQLGLMGFLEFLMRKPDSSEGEGKEAYKTRLEGMLTDSKKRIGDGLKDGIVVGFQKDHEFNFHAPTKDASAVSGIFDINHRMVANGLFMSPHFLGGMTQGSEALLTIVFTKMLSQLHNLHLSLAAILEYGAFLELSLAGFKDPEIEISFNESTLTDKVKAEQAREYQLKNLRVLYAQGIINQNQFAKEAGYKNPAEKEPIEDPDAANNPNKKKQEDDSQTSDRKGRDKAKPQPKRNDDKSQKR